MIQWWQVQAQLLPCGFLVMNKGRSLAARKNILSQGKNILSQGKNILSGCQDWAQYSHRQNIDSGWTGNCRKTCKENPLDCKNICSVWVERGIQGQKNSEENFCFLRKNSCFFPTEGRKKQFFRRKQFSEEFFCPGFLFPPIQIHFLAVQGVFFTCLRQI